MTEQPHQPATNWLRKALDDATWEWQSWLKWRQTVAEHAFVATFQNDHLCDKCGREYADHNEGPTIEELAHLYDGTLNPERAQEVKEYYANEMNKPLGPTTPKPEPKPEQVYRKVLEQTKLLIVRVLNNQATGKELDDFYDYIDETLQGVADARQG
jgi:hypothetical protein